MKLLFARLVIAALTAFGMAVVAPLKCSPAKLPRTGAFKPAGLALSDGRPLLD